MKLYDNENLNVTKIYTVNRYSTSKNETFPIVRHYQPKLPTQELIFFFESDNEVTYNAQMLYDKPNCIRYLPKGTDSRNYTVVSRCPSDCIDIYFDSDIPAADIALTLRDIPEVKSLFLKILNIWNHKKPGYYGEAMSVFYEIITAVRAQQRRYLKSEKAALLEPAVQYILSNYTAPDFSYTALCNVCDLSYSYFKELFCKAYGMPPVKYVTLLRIEKAKELLVTGIYSVSDIAIACGFRNVYYFSNVFKKAVGVSPKDFRSSIGSTIL